MNPVLLAVLTVGFIGLIVGLVLAIASALLSVPKDEKAQALLALLPGANCGACGYSGCSGYANALSKGTAKPGLCSPGGAETTKAIAAMLGTEPVENQRKTAVVFCMGGLEHTADKMLYQGISSCGAAVQLHGGTGKCSYGCMGFGDCKAACEYDAVTICNGLARINPALCRACGKCADACPKGLIRLAPVKQQAVVLCSSCDKGADTKRACTAGCIGCMRCVKACPNGAVKVENFKATVDPALCTGCFACIAQCKQGCLIKAFAQ